MYTLHIENTIDDFAAWQAVFDKYDRMRAERGVRSYRLTRSVDVPTHVCVDLVFGDLAHARQFLPVLERVLTSPQSASVSRSHTAPQIRELVRDTVVDAVAAGDAG